ncbi:BZ3500_MvSof-1268-A1-R1_C048g00172 [Microbotryum saponariae]|uniref:BZ3500_MvSof-1268-A1-R1_C048g00172 protein n=1 Tax=Microbotryum saponariae TaxID=289078 RepID=A0A2X0KLQ1_9BASI|nr:BZ3501_MvSof-1269-A2-R1_Chr1-1g00413 [Microbotryum saponariae]SCZ94885.1 BZ3500_MvSof-1268-A1-R1_C048g00172 [Microbotryum saponariae]
MRHSIRKMQFDLSQLQLNHHRQDAQLSRGHESMQTLLDPRRPTPKHHCRPVTISSATPTSCTRVVNVNQSHECIPSHLFLDRVEESHRRG